MDIDEETSAEYHEDPNKLYMGDIVETPSGDGKVIEFGPKQSEVKVWVKDANQFMWFERKEILKI